MDAFDVDDTTEEILHSNRRSDATRPVTIRQLTQTEIREVLTRTASEPRYSLNGDNYRMATFVGNIIDVVASGENTRTIRIEDDTGKITSTYTINREEDEESPPEWRAGAYARVFGVPRRFNNAMTFNIYRIKPVEDPHEVFFHLMEAIVITLQHSRGPPPALYDSRFARATSPRLPHSTAEPDLSISMRSLILNPTPSGSRLPPLAPSYQVDDDPRDDSKESAESDPLGSTGDAEITGVHDTSDEEDGSTEYYTDPPPESPRERSPSPTPVPFARNHSFEGHLDREEGPSSQLSQSTQRPNVRSSDEESEDGRTSKGKSKSRRNDDESPTKGEDDEIEDLRSEFTSQVLPDTPQRKLKPDPYTGWSPAKRKIMLTLQSKTPGTEVNKRALGDGIPKLEMRNAIKELEKEGEIETTDCISYRLTDKGPKYPRF